MLNTATDAALGGLAELADRAWMMNLPQHRETYCGHSAGYPGGHPSGHPAGSARSGLPGGGGEPVLIAVMFGKPVGSAEADTVLPVQWETCEPGDEFTLLLDGDITLAPTAVGANSTLTLAGFCRLPSGIVIREGYEQARAQVIEAAREFITSVAVCVTGPAGPGREPAGPAWSWLNGLPRT